MSRKEGIGGLPVLNGEVGDGRPRKCRGAMMDAGAAIARLATIIPRRSFTGPVALLRASVINGLWIGGCGSVTSRNTRSRLSCSDAGVAHRTMQMFIVHGRASNARTVCRNGNDQEQPHQERTERHAPEYKRGPKRKMNPQQRRVTAPRPEGSESIITPPSGVGFGPPCNRSENHLPAPPSDGAQPGDTGWW